MRIRLFAVCVALVSAALAAPAGAQSVTVAASQMSARSFHNVVAAGAGFAWVHGGQRFDGQALYWNTSQKIDLATGNVVASGIVPYGYAHASAIDLSGRTVFVGGMSMQGSWFTFRALQELQWVNADGSYGWLTGQLPYGTYDIEAVRLTSSRLIYFGGHAVLPPGTESRIDGGVIERTAFGIIKTGPVMLSVPRVYVKGHRKSDTEAIAIAGGQYTNIAWGLRPVAVIETVSIDGSSRVWAEGLPHPVRYHSTVADDVGGKIYVAGGTLLSSAGRPAATNKLQALDLTTETVTELAPLLFPREHGHLTFCRDASGNPFLVFDGGQSDDRINVTAVELYDVTAQTSSVIGQSAPGIDHDRISVAHGNVIVRLGGEDAVSAQGTSTMTTITLPAGFVCSRQ